MAIPGALIHLFVPHNPQLRNIFRDFGKFEVKKTDKGIYATLLKSLEGNK